MCLVSGNITIRVVHNAGEGKLLKKSLTRYENFKIWTNELYPEQLILKNNTWRQSNLLADLKVEIKLVPRQRFYSDVDSNSHRSHGCLLLCHLKGSLHSCGCHLNGFTRSRLVALVGFSQHRLRIIMSAKISCDDIRPLDFGMDGVLQRRKM